MEINKLRNSLKDYKGASLGKVDSALEEKILFVLSALEDANEALDKCDRFVQKQSTQKPHRRQVKAVEKDINARFSASDSSQTQESQSLHDVDSSSRSIKATSSQVTVVPKGRDQTSKRRRSKAVQTLPAPPASLPKNVQTMSPKVPSKTVSNTRLKPKPATTSAEADSPRCRSDEQCCRLRRCTCTCSFPPPAITKDPPNTSSDVAKIMEKFQDNNELQWRNVRKFIRQVLISELEQEKSDRKSTESLNTQLVKQNYYLRCKLEEKKQERVKLSESMKKLKEHYSSKVQGLLEENQQLVKHQSQGAFEKLTKLYGDLERIQANLQSDFAQISKTQQRSGAQSFAEQGCSQFQSDAGISDHVCSGPSGLHSAGCESTALDGAAAFFRKTGGTYSEDRQGGGGESGEQQDFCRQQEILREYYPIIVDYRRLLENFLERVDNSEVNNNTLKRGIQFEEDGDNGKASYACRGHHGSTSNGDLDDRGTSRTYNLLELFVQDCHKALPNF